MALTDATINTGVDALTAIMGFASLHDADPGLTGADEITGGGYARLAVTWDPATGRVAALNGTLEFSGPASASVSHIGLWSAVSGGTFRGGDALTGDTAFNASGEYNVTSITLTGANA